MRRRSNSQKFHHRWKRKLLAALLLGFCFATFVLMESEYSRIKMLSLISPPLIRKPKIAFLFIARNRIPLDMVWDAFFQGADKDRFSVYVHSRPGFLLTATTTRSTYFLNRQINDSVQVDWGEASMIQAERILLQNALMDHYNERFLFLSDSCIPLYNFSYTYDYIMSASTSFVDSFADTKEGRYNPKMHPVIPVENWRKGSQWVVLTRKHAEIVVQDDTVYPMFEQHCKASHPLNFLLMDLRSITVYQMSIMFKPYLLDPERRGWHPVTYKLADATPKLIQSIKDIVNIYYETEYRREWCTSKGKPSRCFLFARKFTRPAALRLLNTSALGIFSEATNGGN
ncbi:UNVERIFIED_CONTAM: Glycosyltransferase BC10 [Sesamum radiatum]|uniref:Glycosyltransferase BC10 n=1 Tax=Sesamum radiatum TaxID=300843 RepID=A0AAW2V5P6_SESRA